MKYKIAAIVLALSASAARADISGTSSIKMEPSAQEIDRQILTYDSTAMSLRMLHPDIGYGFSALATAAEINRAELKTVTTGRTLEEPVLSY
jgi:hypothetical protein